MSPQLRGIIGPCLGSSTSSTCWKLSTSNNLGANISLKVFISFLSRISFSYCLMSIVWKQLFLYILSFFNCFKKEGKSIPCYSILVESTSIRESKVLGKRREFTHYYQILTWGQVKSEWKTYFHIFWLGEQWWGQFWAWWEISILKDWFWQ